MTYILKPERAVQLPKMSFAPSPQAVKLYPGAEYLYTHPRFPGVLFKTIASLQEARETCQGIMYIHEAEKTRDACMFMLVGNTFQRALDTVFPTYRRYVVEGGKPSASTVVADLLHDPSNSYSNGGKVSTMYAEVVTEPVDQSTNAKGLFNVMGVVTMAKDGYGFVSSHTYGNSQNWRSLSGYWLSSPLLFAPLGRLMDDNFATMFDAPSNVRRYMHQAAKEYIIGGELKDEYVGVNAVTIYSPTSTAEDGSFVNTGIPGSDAIRRGIPRIHPHYPQSRHGAGFLYPTYEYPFTLPSCAVDPIGSENALVQSLFSGHTLALMHEEGRSELVPFHFEGLLMEEAYKEATNRLVATGAEIFARGTSTIGPKPDGLGGTTTGSFTSVAGPYEFISAVLSGPMGPIGFVNAVLAFQAINRRAERLARDDN